MSGTYSVTMGDRGRLVVPLEVRRRGGLTEGRLLTLIDTGAGLVLLTREQLKERVRRDLAGLDLVGDLFAGRSRAAADEDRDDR